MAVLKKGCDLIGKDMSLTLVDSVKDLLESDNKPVDLNRLLLKYKLDSYAQDALEVEFKKLTGHPCAKVSVITDILKIARL